MWKVRWGVSLGLNFISLFSYIFICFYDGEYLGWEGMGEKGVSGLYFFMGRG